jgi:hypothetical protein
MRVLGSNLIKILIKSRMSDRNVFERRSISHITLLSILTTLYVFFFFCYSENGKTVKNVKIQEKEKQTLETGFLERSFFLILFLDPLRLDTGE